MADVREAMARTELPNKLTNYDMKRFEQNLQEIGNINTIEYILNYSTLFDFSGTLAS